MRSSRRWTTCSPRPPRPRPRAPPPRPRSPAERAMIRVFIGYDSRETVAYGVLAHSINRHASQPVAIAPVMLGQLEGVFQREKNPLQSTEFSFSRFLVPYLCGYQGWAVFMDCDMLVREDI